MTDLALGRRERKNQQTRDAITRAALELTLERGYERATIAEIAERADVSARTVHTWFRAKEDIVMGGLDAPLERLVADLRTGAGDTVDRIERWLAGESQTMGPLNELGHLRLRALATDPHLRGLQRQRLNGPERAVAEAVAADTGVLPDSLAARAFAAAAINILLDLGARFADRNARELPENLADAFTLLRGALAALRDQRSRPAINAAPSIDSTPSRPLP